MAFPFSNSRRRASYGRSRFGQSGRGRSSYGRRGGGIPVRLLIGLAVIAFSLLSYYFKTDTNPITGEEQRVALADEADEVAIGFQAAPGMIEQHGGRLTGQAAMVVEDVGNELVRSMELAYLDGQANPYRFEFFLLQDPQTVNAFALPGGPVFITQALYNRLETRGRLAGVLGHEIGHVVARHGNQRMAQQKRDQGISSGVAVASGSYNTARMAQMAIQTASMKHGRDQELESDEWGVRLMPLAGYDPADLIEVMNVLEAASGGASGPEFASTHPSPANRREQITASIEKLPPGALDKVNPRKTNDPLPPIQSRGSYRSQAPRTLQDLLGR